MPRKLRRLTGPQVVVALKRCGFVEVSRRGSHAKLQRILAGEKQTLVVPVASALAIGTLAAIVRQAAQYLSQAEIETEFYAD